jgi:adenosylmethionine-8-amino-7-oxononanoate aminotransferase
LGGGFAPIGAVLVRNTSSTRLRGSGLFQHGLTYLGHPLACAGALAVQKVVRRENLLSRNRRD